MRVEMKRRTVVYLEQKLRQNRVIDYQYEILNANQVKNTDLQNFWSLVTQVFKIKDDFTKIWR